jgi:hypothetical protein
MDNVENVVLSEDFSVTPVTEAEGELTTEGEPAGEEVNNLEVGKKEVQITEYTTLGDKRCYIYMDLQYTGLKKNADIISLALLEGGTNRSFYAEFTDYDMQKCDGWVFENVIKKLKNPPTLLEGDSWTIVGTREDIRVAIAFWLNEFHADGKPAQFVGDVGHLGFVLFEDLMCSKHDSPTSELPGWISPALVDLNQDIATVLYRKKPDDISEEDFDKWYIPSATAFMVNRVDCAKSILGKDVGEYHNALDQVKIIKAIHQYIWNK